MKSALRWFGGKYRVLPFLLPLMPEHKRYCEPFFGGGSVFFAKKPCEVEVINDLDGDVINFYRVLQDAGQSEEFRRRVTLTPYSRELFETFRDEPPPADSVERAYRWFVVNRQSYGGAMGQWSYSVTLGRQRGLAASIAVWLNGVECLTEIAIRLLATQIECDDYRSVLERYDTPETLHYLDPPYHPETRVRGGYACEMTAEDHVDLVERVQSLTGMVMLSGYLHDTYAPLEKAGWERRDFDTVAQMQRANREKTQRTESLWLNPLCQRRRQLSLFSGEAA